jgi:hypothetical protein
MKRLTNINNFVRYRSNMFNDFLILYSLYRYNSNWKHFLKVKNLFYINFFLKTKQLSIKKIKRLSSVFLNFAFIYQIYVTINLRLNEYLVLINYLKMVYLTYIDFKFSKVIIGVNTWLDFIEIFLFLSYLNDKLLKKEDYCEILNIVFKLIPTKFILNFIFYNKVGLKNIIIYKKIIDFRFFQITSSLIICEVFFIQVLLYFYSIIFMYFFNILFFLVNYGNISAVRKRL